MYLNRHLRKEFGEFCGFEVLELSFRAFDRYRNPLIMGYYTLKLCSFGDSLSNELARLYSKYMICDPFSASIMIMVLKGGYLISALLRSINFPAAGFYGQRTVMIKPSQACEGPTALKPSSTSH